MVKKTLLWSTMFILTLNVIGCGSSTSSSTSLASSETDAVNVQNGDFHFTKDDLEGKTLYYVVDDDFHQEGLLTEWNMMSCTFTDNEVLLQEIDLPDNDSATFPYTLDENGSIVIQWSSSDGEEQGEWIIDPIDNNGTVIRAIDSDDTVYLFYSEEEAKAFRDAKNSESTMSGFTKEFLVGKTLYYVANDDFGHDDLDTAWNMGEMSFTDTEFTWNELVEGGNQATLSYIIDETGAIIGTWTDGDERGTVGYSIISANSRVIHVLDPLTGGEDEGYFFFSKEDAIAFRDRQNALEMN